MQTHGIAPIDLLVVNLYPFEATVATRRRLRRLHREHRHRRPGDDPRRGQEPRRCRGGGRPAGLRRRARPSWQRTTARRRSRCASGSPPRPLRAPPPMTRRSRTGSPTRSAIAAPAYRAFGGQLAEALRYGENPHQAAAFYRTPEARPGVATARQLQGKQLSYNNINDTDAAFECVAEFDPARTAACAIIKHANPCGVAEGATLVEAYRKALRLRSGLGLRRHRRAQPHARRRGRARDRRDLHRGDHRARRDRGGDRHRRREEEPAPAAHRRPARSARARA